MTASAPIQPRRALLSVSDKSGLVEFARALAARNIELLSTGGTARSLREAGLEVRDVSEITGFPEIMDGRVKTLHPRIHGGLLGRTGTDDAVMAEQGIPPIDILAVNLYPFEKVAARADATLEDLVENIDIGGPAMLRAAAKNFARVAVLTDPSQYATLLADLEAHNGTTLDTRLKLAQAAFARAAQYNEAIQRTLETFVKTGPEASTFPSRRCSGQEKSMDLRYGENPHQKAAFYRDSQPGAGSLASFEQLQGKALSYNNLADADAAWECVRQFETPACVIVKHANPCGVAVGHDAHSAWQRAFATDPVSAFGGIIAFNTAPDAATLEAILKRQFVEVLIAPDFSPAALAAAAHKKNVRLLKIPLGEHARARELKRIGGGLLVQDADSRIVTRDELRVVTKKAPTDAQLDDLMFAWKVAKFVKSNAIVYAHEGQTIGVGAGQMSRIDSARIASLKALDAKLEVSGSVMASDAFFPFRDGIDAAAEAGIRAVIQPGGSIRDEEVIQAADEHGMAMVFTGIRHFRH